MDNLAAKGMARPMRMIWPYLAVVIDSFRSALSSRVLWAAMIAIWVLLGAIAPLSLREDYTTSFRWFDVYNGTRLKGLLAQGLVDPDQAISPLGRIAAQMPDELQRKLRRVGEGEEVRIRVDQLSDALNELIEKDAVAAQPNSGAKTWFDSDAWKSTVRLRELRELDQSAPEDLTDSLLRRRARLRIEAALPGVFEARSPRSVVLTYAGLDFPTGLPIDKAQFERLFNQFVIPTLVHWLLGFVLVFLGVLVTASIIPEMLQPGSLHLLLSKPISRSGLLLAKFVGGCAFVTLCVAQLVLGLYLIAGLRMGIWNPRILWCVPVSVFLFSVFFSVSVPAGLKWRSPIISIAAAGALAAICVVVGVIGGIFDARVVQTDRIDSLLVVGEDWIGTTGGSGLVRWDRSANRWESLIAGEAMSQDRVLDPIRIDDETIVTARIRGGRFSPFGSGAVDLVVMSRPNDWSAQPSLRLPNATQRLMHLSDEKIMAINTSDLLVASQRLIVSTANDEPIDSSSAPDAKPKSPVSGASGSGSPGAGSLGGWMRGLMTLQGGATEEFTSIAPSQLSLSPPVRLSVLNEGTESSLLVVLAGDRLQTLRATDEESSPWELAANVELEPIEAKTPPLIATAGDLIVLCRGDGKLQCYDSSLKLIASVDLPETITPLSMLFCPVRETDRSLVPGAARFAVLTTQGEIWGLEIGSSSTDAAPAIGWIEAGPIQEAVSMAFDQSQQRLIVAHDVDRLSVLDCSANSDDLPESDQGPNSNDWKVQERLIPELTTWRWVDRYVLGTIQMLTPRVLDLGDTTATMVSGQESFVIPPGESDQVEVVRFQTTGPLVSCGAFIAVMLLLSCVMFSKTDY